MARGRIIKPEFWTDGVIVELSMAARLFYIGLWNFANCDAGHLPDDPRGLKLKIFPGDTIDAEALVNELVDAGRLKRFSLADGRAFLHIRRFAEHQKSDTRWTPRCPVCQSLAEPQPNSPEFRSAQPDSPQLGVKGEGKGLEEEGKGTETSPPPSRYCEKHQPDGTDQVCGRCKDARLRFEQWERSRPSVRIPPRTLGQNDCSEHPGYPAYECQRCERDRSEAVAS